MQIGKRRIGQPGALREVIGKSKSMDAERPCFHSMRPHIHAYMPSFIANAAA